MHVPRATLAIYFHKEIKLDSLIALSVTMVGIYIGPSLSVGMGLNTQTHDEDKLQTSCQARCAGQDPRRVSAQQISSASQLGIPWRHQAVRMDTRQAE